MYECINKLLLHSKELHSFQTKKCTYKLQITNSLTWYTLLIIVIVGIGIGVFCGGVLTTPNPWTEVVEGHLFNERGSIFSKVPPLKYL